ncbi:metallophosphatase [Microvirga vignae]|uniref:3'-phosphate/5'-hydroxy nucleic acid ligase n=1 Tax=Microvirga vignae TaxID=1225564 RepID=A0A0H1RLQ7_9HYPH|nr:RtcB family protein [Microvirga vignae]KLK93577.1 metallophosphatase [Microvirga vignae]
MNTRIYGEHDERTIQQLNRCMRVGSAAKGVLCADGHLGYAHPIGGVVAYEEHISISGVGFDIACGNMAVRLDTRYDDIAREAARILSDIGKTISFGIGQKNAVAVDHELFDSPLWDKAGVRDLKKMASQQLGTVGSGNHYVDLFEDEKGFVWIGVHFGSRGLGHKITTKHLALAGAKDGMEVAPALVHQNSEIGRSYLAGVTLGGLYAYAGREWVVERVRQIIGGTVVDSVHNHHNFVWRENHGGRDYWVVRKGATPAFPGQRGFVGGSMGDNAVILHGVENEQGADSLYSTVHGAGRLFGRMEAKGKKNKKGEWVRPPRFTREEMDSWLREKGVLLRGGDVDESPMVYRRLEDVLAYHGNTIEIEHTLRPFAVAMAGPGEFDPYKD